VVKVGWVKAFLRIGESCRKLSVGYFVRVGVDRWQRSLVRNVEQGRKEYG
jgi:hypothetical protein